MKASSLLSKVLSRGAVGARVFGFRGGGGDAAFGKGCARSVATGSLCSIKSVDRRRSWTRQTQRRFHLLSIVRTLTFVLVFSDGSYTCHLTVCTLLIFSVNSHPSSVKTHLWFIARSYLVGTWICKPFHWVPEARSLWILESLPWVSGAVKSRPNRAASVLTTHVFT